MKTLLTRGDIKMPAVAVGAMLSSTVERRVIDAGDVPSAVRHICLKVVLRHAYVRFAKFYCLVLGHTPKARRRFQKLRRHVRSVTQPACRDVIARLLFCKYYLSDVCKLRKFARHV